jgi:hypothetical protein
MANPTIITTSARLDDGAAMAQFLSPIPDADQLAKLLAKGVPVSTRAYDDENQIARYVESDGEAVLCFMVHDVTIDEAEMIEIEFEDTGAGDEVAFRKAVVRALGDV